MKISFTDLVFDNPEGISLKEITVDINHVEFFWDDGYTTEAELLDMELSEEVFHLSCIHRGKQFTFLISTINGECSTTRHIQYDVV